MSFVQLLLLFRSLPIRDLLDYPDDLRDEQDVRRWLVAVCTAGDVLADLTDTNIDDTVVNAVKSVVNDAGAFGVIYSLVLNVFTFENENFPDTYFDSHEDAAEAAERTGLAPAMIIAIVQVVIMLLKFIRNRRN